ncbi:hypothetical protein PILCRDRAFT_803253, partial [Piloderma croceum F 1598]
IGTALHTSINTYLGGEQAYCVNFEFLAYVLMCFLRGALPWQRLKAATKKQRYDHIVEKKMTPPTDLLCWCFPTNLESSSITPAPFVLTTRTRTFASFSVTFAFAKA